MAKPIVLHMKDKKSEHAMCGMRDRTHVEKEKVTCKRCLGAYRKLNNDKNKPPPKNFDLRKTPATIMLEEEQAQLIRQIEFMAGIGSTADEICDVVGVKRSKLFVEMKKNGQLATAMKKGRAKAGNKIMETAYQMATNGKNTAMTIFWLKVNKRWAEANKLEVDQNLKVTFDTVIGQAGDIIQEMQIDGESDPDQK